MIINVGGRIKWFFASGLLACLMTIIIEIYANQLGLDFIWAFLPMMYVHHLLTLRWLRQDAQKAFHAALERGQVEEFEYEHPLLGGGHGNPRAERLSGKLAGAPAH